jgi:alkaline phosphatase D
MEAGLAVRLTNRGLGALALALALAGCAGSAPVAEVTPQPLAAWSAPSVLQDFPTAPVSPALPTGTVTTLTLASCINEERAQPALARMAAQPADLALLLGDNVYGSWTAEDPVLSDLRSAYWQQSRKPEFRQLVSTRPTLAIWDDHDFGVNDGGGETFAQRRLALEMFQRFWNMPADSPQRHTDGVYGAYVFGQETGRRLQVILLDTRFNRSPLRPTDERGARGRERYLPDDDPARTMLGATQWAWLETQLRQPADLRIIASSVQIVAEGHGWERWGNFPREQQRMYDLIAQTGARGVFFVSGDRHYSAINEAPAGRGPYRMVDFTASSINMPWTAGDSEALPTMITPAFTVENYGVVRIDWAGAKVTMELRDNQDAVVLSQDVGFSDLGL